MGLLKTAVEFVANPAELDLVFTVPLEFLARREQLILDEVRYRNRLRRVPRYEYGEHTIWGVTAAMLVQLVNSACDAGLILEDYWKGEGE